MARSEEEIENLWKLQSEVNKRSESVKTIICDLQTEREKLKERVAELKDDIENLTTWVETNCPRLMNAASVDGEIEEMFEMELAVESLAADNGIEDVLGALEEAAEKGELEMGSYLRQVRVLAREQFFNRMITLDLCKNSNFHI